jgi:hypothetical protein
MQTNLIYQKFFTYYKKYNALFFLIFNKKLGFDNYVKVRILINNVYMQINKFCIFICLGNH